MPSKQYEVIVHETMRTGYLVQADSAEEAQSLIENMDRTYPQSFSEYYDLDHIESVEEDK